MNGFSDELGLIIHDADVELNSGAGAPTAEIDRSRVRADSAAFPAIDASCDISDRSRSGFAARSKNIRF